MIIRLDATFVANEDPEVNPITLIRDAIEEFKHLVESGGFVYLNDYDLRTAD